MTSDHLGRSTFVAHDVPDLINVVPVLLGFRPTESLVAIATNGPRRRFGFRMRLDFSPGLDPDDLATFVVTHLEAQGAEGVVVLVLTEHQAAARDALAAIEAGLGPIEPVVLARADVTHYWVDVPGFPAGGVAYELEGHHVAVVHAIVEGQEILPDREALVRRYAAARGDQAERAAEAVSAVLPGVLDRMRSSSGPLGPVGLGELRGVVGKVEAGVPLDDVDTARLVVWAHAVEVRTAIGALVTPDTARRWLPALAHAARAAVPPFEPAVLCLAAYAAWLTGDGAQARVAVDRALGADPRSTLALALLDVLDRGVRPPRPGDASLTDVG